MGLRWGRVGLEWGLGGKVDGWCIVGDGENDIETSRKQNNKLDIWFIFFYDCGGDMWW